MMCKALGWDLSIQHLAKKMVYTLGSMKPNYAFSVLGERRAGRSSVFRSLAEAVNNDHDKDILCLVGELDEPSLTCISQTLMQMTDKLTDAIDSSLYDIKPGTVHGFFEFIEKISSITGKKPILLIDMGKAMEQSSDAEALMIAQYLKPIVNMMEDRGVPFILGLGWTRKFFDRIISISGDVYRDRYRTELFLGVAYESDNPYDIFKEIVKKVSSVLLPDEYEGLLRVPGITAAMFGENIVKQGIKEVSSPGDIWCALKGTWTLVPYLSFPGLNLSTADLARLLLADSAIETRKVPEYLESLSSGGFIANDALYEKFGILPPRRDPSALERLRNRLRDVEECSLLMDIMNPLSQSLSKIGSVTIEGPLDFSGNTVADRPLERTSFLSVQVNELPVLSSDARSSLQKINMELDKKVFPHKFSIGLYLDDPNHPEFEQKISAAGESEDFLLILCSPLSANIGETSLARKLRDKIFSVINLSEEDILELISEHTVEDKKIQTIVEWLYICMEKQLKKKSAFPLLFDSAKKILSTVIANGGSILFDDLKKRLQIEVEVSELRVILTRMNDAQFIEKKKDMLYWNILDDPIISCILSGKSDKDLLQCCILDKFTLSLNPFNYSEILLPYAGIFGTKELKDYYKGDLIQWYIPNRATLLRVIHDKIDKEQELITKYLQDYETLNNTEINEWESIPGDRNTIEEFDKAIDNELEMIVKRRNEEEARLEEKKAELRDLITKNESCYKQEEREDFEKTIKGFRKSDSDGIKQLKGRLNKRIQDYKNYTIKLDVLKNNLNKLGSSEKIREDLEELRKSLVKLDTYIEDLNFSDFNTIANEVEKKIEELDRTRRIEIILRAGGVRESTPIYGVGSIPQPPGVGSIPQPPSVGSIPQPPGVGSIPQLPGVGSIPQPPGMGSIPQPPGMGSIPQPPGVGSIPQPPGVGSIPQPPGVGSIPQPPGMGSIPQPPGVGSIPQPPAGSIPQPPAGSIPQPPAGSIPQPPGGSIVQLPDGGSLSEPPKWKEVCHTFDLSIREDCINLARLIVNNDVVIKKIALEKD